VPTSKGVATSSVAAVLCVMPVVTEFVTLLLADFVTGYPA
jgi:hypothetical protein